MLILLAANGALAQGARGVGIEQAMANAGPEVMLRDTQYAMIVVEIATLAPGPFTNGSPPTGTVTVKESLRGALKLEPLEVTWRPMPAGFDTPNPAGVKKWQATAFAGVPVVGQTRILIGHVRAGQFEVIANGDLPGEKRAWVRKKLGLDK